MALDNCRHYCAASIQKSYYMNAHKLYEKIQELEGIEPDYRKGTGIGVDSMALLLGTSTEHIAAIAEVMESLGMAKLVIPDEVDSNNRKHHQYVGVIVLT